MFLYRGMSDIEWKIWREEGAIPKGKNFTTCPQEAYKLGYHHTLDGELIVLKMDYDDLAFQKTLPASSTGMGTEWYESSREIGLGEFVTEGLDEKFQ